MLRPLGRGSTRYIDAARALLPQRPISTGKIESTTQMYLHHARGVLAYTQETPVRHVVGYGRGSSTPWFKYPVTVL
jgi:hypothetical protein